VEVLYTQPALEDLEAIKAWSWEFHPQTTEQFLTALLNHIDLLGKLPAMGRPVKGYDGVRQLLHTPFEIYYRVNKEREAVEVLHVWHHARRTPQLLP
jgi:plasmid stabilization system protein ParE